MQYWSHGHFAGSFLHTMSLLKSHSFICRIRELRFVLGDEKIAFVPCFFRFGNTPVNIQDLKQTTKKRFEEWKTKWIKRWFWSFCFLCLHSQNLCLHVICLWCYRDKNANITVLCTTPLNFYLFHIKVDISIQNVT